MIRALIVEDEKASRDALRALLARYCGEVEVVGEADGVRKGIQQIRDKKPDVVFLDIQMPDGSGFRLLEEVRDEQFEVIFTTAFDQFGIRAIKYSALDYLLKPIDADELIQAVNKLKKQEFRLRASQNIDALLENIKHPDEAQKIVLSTAERIHVVGVDEIIRCESDNYYTRFFFTSGKTLLISKTLKEHEALLADHHFIRPHKSHLVNLKYIKQYSRMDGGTLILEDGARIPVSRRKRELVVRTISRLGTGLWKDELI
jgi:two-component system LytT family response regulator